ncbi:hypothetical protein IH781_00780 [Patescibacteria group bacterium]|nr:hypothetical protein [Patescibacteria group bacterium]
MGSLKKGGEGMKLHYRFTALAAVAGGIGLLLALAVSAQVVVQPPGPGPEPAVNVREAKQAVIDTLSAFVGESPRFEKAIREITKSLEPVRWLDDSHLESRHGHKVFSREYHAVKELLRLLKNSHGLTVSAAARSAASVAIDDLVEVDRLLAQIRLG